MRQVALPDGRKIPVLGQGTWRMGEHSSRAAEEAKALAAGIDAGMTLIDTAEIYGEGRTETFLGSALAGRRDDVFLVSKAHPRNAARERLAAACEGSLRRLKTDRLDLYLLHWRSSVPLAETVEGMAALEAAGKIGAWGVSNFDTSEMQALLDAGGDGCATNQVLYNVSRRGPDFELQPWLTEHRMPLMAYSPVEQGRLRGDGPLAEIGERHGVDAYQVAIAWTIRAGAFAIPKAGTVAHVRANAAAADLALSPEDLAAIDAAYPPPNQRRALDML